MFLLFQNKFLKLSLKTFSSSFKTLLKTTIMFYVLCGLEHWTLTQFTVKNSPKETYRNKWFCEHSSNFLIRIIDL